MFGAKGDGSNDDTTAISAAISAAGAGGTVLFASGKTYKTTSQISIGVNNLTLTGYGAVITSATETQYRKFTFTSRTRGAVYGLRFECLYSSTTTSITTGTIEVTNSSDITIEGCEINETAGCGVFINGNSARINVVNNQFYKCFVGVFSDDDTTNTCTYLKIVGNQIRTGLGTSSTAFSGAIKISSLGNANSYVGHVISNNLILSAGQMGIELQGWCNGSVVSSNSIYGVGFGVSLSFCSRVSVTGNTIREVDAYGVEVADSLSVDVVGNNICGDSTAYGVIVNNSQRVTVNGNVMDSCDQGIFTVGSRYLTYVGNQMNLGIGGAIYLQGGASGITNVNISSNSFAITGANTFNYIFLDAAAGIVNEVLIEGNHLAGDPSNNGITCYSPDSGAAIRDIQIQNNHCNFFAGGGAISTTGVFAPGDKLYAWRCTNNAGAGDDVNGQTNFNYYYAARSSDLSFYWNYMTLEGGIMAVNASGASRVITLPNANAIAGYTLTVTKSDAQANIVTVTGYGGQTINGAISYVLSGQNQSATFFSNSTQWLVQNSYP